jgi:D-aspartate ligase
MQTVASPGSRNPEKADAGWPPVVVGGAFQSGLNLMRDLLRRGVQVIAVDYDLTHHGFRSVYGKTVHCPNPDLDGPLWLQFMKDLSVELGQKPVFIPAADAFVMALGRYAPELADHYLNSPEAARLQAELSSKDTQYELCAKFG